MRSRLGYLLRPQSSAASWRATGLLVMTLVLGVGSASHPAEAATARRIAVLDLRNGTGFTEEEAVYLADVVRSAVSDGLTSEWLVMTRESMVALLPPGRTLVDCVKSAACEVDMGRQLGAEYIVSGEALKFAGEYRVILKLHKCESGAFLGGAMAKGRKPADVEEGVPAAVKQLTDRLVQVTDAPKPQSKQAAESASSSTPDQSTTQQSSQTYPSIRLSNGIVYQDLVIGSGKQYWHGSYGRRACLYVTCYNAQGVKVHDGRALGELYCFDASSWSGSLYGDDQAFDFVLSGMKVGGRRRIVVPGNDWSGWCFKKLDRNPCTMNIELVDFAGN